jgi:peptidoglycan hydrolase-like protein with peptidoglycan-binding domain
MIGILNRCKHVALTAAVAAGMVGLTIPGALAWNTSASRTTVRSAQTQLKNDGFYKGAIDGIDGPMTHAAIRKFQHSNNLAVNGRLDSQTRTQLGLPVSGEASRAATMPQSNTSAATNQNGQAQGHFSANTVKAAQQQLKQQGYYSGNVSGNVGPNTQMAIRKYQKANNLPVTGQLNPATLKSLGVRGS